MCGRRRRGAPTPTPAPSGGLRARAGRQAEGPLSGDGPAGPKPGSRPLASGLQASAGAQSAGRLVFAAVEGQEDAGDAPALAVNLSWLGRGLGGRYGHVLTAVANSHPLPGGFPSGGEPWVESQCSEH